ncbi:hypothetical protein EAF00_008950 [Botryotinia globosa]|nr:hypothetical protein EAF00_008950 [Botryotinia globosa]
MYLKEPQVYESAVRKAWYQTVHQSRAWYESPFPTQSICSAQSGKPLTGGKMKEVDGGILKNFRDAECVSGLEVSCSDPSFEYTRLEINSAWRYVSCRSWRANALEANKLISGDRNQDGSPIPWAVFRSNPAKSL